MALAILRVTSEWIECITPPTLFGSTTAAGRHGRTGCVRWAGTLPPTFHIAPIGAMWVRHVEAHGSPHRRLRWPAFSWLRPPAARSAPLIATVGNPQCDRLQTAALWQGVVHRCAMRRCCRAAPICRYARSDVITARCVIALAPRSLAASGVPNGLELNNVSEVFPRYSLLIRLRSMHIQSK